MITPLPLSLYIHIPWCIQKCPYCDFNSHEKQHGYNEQKYLEALKADLDQEVALRSTHTLGSIFFGGGTPSLFSAATIGDLLEHVSNYFNINEQTEITLEANPGTFEQEKFAGFRSAGINRLSIGIQSFNDRHLQALGRIHDRRQAQHAIDMAVAAGFDNINLDLMFGLPDQTVEQAVADIKIAHDTAVPHISHYQLTIEPNTYFSRYTPSLPETDRLWEMQTECQSLLAANGFRQYEVSAYAQPGRQSKHNVNYWQFGDYIGIGAGAHGKLSSIDPDSGLMSITRRWKHRQPAAYMSAALSGSALSGEDMIADDDRCFEFLLNALRLQEGCDARLFQQHTGLELARLQAYSRNIDPELLEITDKTIRTTDRGFLFLNNILEQLL